MKLFRLASTRRLPGRRLEAIFEFRRRVLEERFGGVRICVTLWRICPGFERMRRAYLLCRIKS